MEGERGGGSINTISTDGGPAGGEKRRQKLKYEKHLTQKYKHISR